MWTSVKWSACLQGINYLLEIKLLDGSAQSIAEFLYKEEGLNKTAIGEFLGERWVRPGSVQTAVEGRQWGWEWRKWKGVESEREEAKTQDKLG